METQCTGGANNKEELSAILMSLGGAMGVATILIWLLLICKEKRRWKASKQIKPRTQRLSQITRTGLQGASRRIWRTQSFFKESVPTQPIRIPRPVTYGNEEFGRHRNLSRGQDDLEFDICAENSYCGNKDTIHGDSLARSGNDFVSHCNRSEMQTFNFNS